MALGTGNSYCRTLQALCDRTQPAPQNPAHQPCARPGLCEPAGEGASKSRDFFCSCSQTMDSPLRRKDIWIVGSVCLISSSLFWRVFQSVMTRRGRRQTPALQDAQVVTLLTQTHSVYCCLNVCSQGVVLARGANAGPGLPSREGGSPAGEHAARLNISNT